MTTREIRDNLKSLPQRHRRLVGFCTFLLLIQGIYLSKLVLVCFYNIIVFEVPKELPAECEYREDNYGAPPTYIEEGGVEFNVDMRCVGADKPGILLDVYVTGPFCGNCPSEGWNTLTDPEGDGIYTGSVVFTSKGPGRDGEPLTGSGILYRYAANFRGSSSNDRWVRFEDLSDDMSQGAQCAVASDETGSLRLIVTEAWPVAAWDIFDSCTDVNISAQEAAEIWESDHQELNSWVAKNVDPWYRPTLKVLSHITFVHPIFYLTVCSLTYVYSIIVVGRSYTVRKERDLMDLLETTRLKSTYLEHAAKILRHDMNSGINIYLPRGLQSLQKRLQRRPEIIEELRLEPPLKLLTEGLEHTRKVYQGITDFTDIVREGGQLKTELVSLSEVLREFFSKRAYSDQVVVHDLPTISVNANLFCTAIDNLVRNGLKYNDSPSKLVVVRMIDADNIGVIDNGRGLSQEDFLRFSKPWVRKEGQEESGSGLGLNICIAILKEHGFTVSSCIRKRKDETGTIIKVGIA